MKKKIITFLKVALPLTFGVFLIWYVFKDLSPTEKEDLYTAFKQADYFWIILSVFLGLLSHLSRAIRWKYTIKPLGKTPKLWNSFFSIMIGYVSNLAFPRLGEVTRPAVLAKYENIPFNKLFGTIVAERAADLLILLLIIIGVILMEFELLGDLLYQFIEESSGKFSTTNIIILIGIAAIGFSVLLFLALSKSQKPLFVKIRELLKGILEGVKTIITMEDKWPFIFHTIFIWVMYIGMFYLCFFSLKETIAVPPSGVLAAFVMGTIAVVFVQGGLGVFPMAIMKTLALYEVSKASALALGWILWTSQTLMLIIAGILSIPLLRIINKKYRNESSESNSK